MTTDIIKDALKTAQDCIAYCRRAHEDVRNCPLYHALHDQALVHLGCDDGRVGNRPMSSNGRERLNH